MKLNRERLLVSSPSVSLHPNRSDLGAGLSLSLICRWRRKRRPVRNRRTGAKAGHLGEVSASVKALDEIQLRKCIELVDQPGVRRASLSLALRRLTPPEVAILLANGTS